MKQAKKLLPWLWGLLVAALGGVLSGYAFAHLYVPHGLLSGGVSGIALLIHKLTGFSVGSQLLLYNIPILLFGLRSFGSRFLVYTAANLLATSLVTNQVTPTLLVDDPLLSAIFAGLLNGLGIGLALRVGGSSGGFDILGIVLNRRFSIGIGDVVLAVNLVIVSLGALYSKDITVALYTLIAIYGQGQVVNSLQLGQPKVTALIISPKATEIATAVLTHMGRGVTYLQGEGGFTHTQVRVMLCVVSRLELADLKRHVLAADPDAFMFVLATDEVVGRFKTENPLLRLGREFVPGHRRH